MHRVPRRRGCGRGHPARSDEDPGDDVRTLSQRARCPGGRELAGGARRGRSRRRRSRGLLRLLSPLGGGRNRSDRRAVSPGIPRGRGEGGQRRRLRRLPRPAPLEPVRCVRSRRLRGGGCRHEFSGALGGRAGGAVHGLSPGAGRHRRDAARPDEIGGEGRALRGLSQRPRRSAARRCSRATAEAGGQARAGERSVRGLSCRGEDGRGRNRRRARASGRREPGAGFRAGSAALRLHRRDDSQAE